MIDDLFDRDYQATRDQVNGGIASVIARFAAAFGNAFKVLNRIEYAAPWASGTKRAHGN